MAVAVGLTVFAFVGMLAAGIDLLENATTEPLVPVGDGGLYLLVNKPGVQATFDVSVTEYRSPIPGSWCTSR
jgi:hypothetical protein